MFSPVARLPRKTWWSKRWRLPAVNQCIKLAFAVTSPWHHHDSPNIDVWYMILILSTSKLRGDNMHVNTNFRVHESANWFISSFQGSQVSPLLAAIWYPSHPSSYAHGAYRHIRFLLIDPGWQCTGESLGERLQMSVHWWFTGCWLKPYSAYPNNPNMAKNDVGSGDFTMPGWCWVIRK